MSNYKILLGYAATIISIVSYIPYYRSIFKGQTKPHAFSWFIWSLLSGIAFFAQVSQHGGAGAWVIASTSLACLGVFILALFKGVKDFTTFDWYSLFTAIIAMVVWYFMKDPTLSVIMVTVIDAVGYFPTFRKSYYKPYDETISLYIMSTTKYVLGLFALQYFSLATWLFPASLVLTNGAFVLMLLFRRRSISPYLPTNTIFY